MKILFYIDSLYSGGKERRLVELIIGLSKIPGYEMLLVLSKKEIHYKQIFATGIKIHYIERGKFKKNPMVFIKFYRITKKFLPDVIHVWTYTEAIFTLPVKILLGIPLINSQIASSPNVVSHSIFRHKLTFKFSDKILPNSYAGKEAYHSVMTSKSLEKCKVIYNGFNFNRIMNLKSEEVIRKKFNIQSKYIIGMVANFSYKKDYNTFIKAAHLVLEKENDISFLCIGSGDSDKEKQLVIPENRKKILFLGKQNDIESIMNICDIGVLSTYTEGISNSLLEFMALEKPIIVTGGGGCQELVSHNENGYLLIAGDYQGLAMKIKKLIKDNLKRLEYGKKSKIIVQKKFSLPKIIKEFETVYQEFLN